MSEHKQSEIREELLKLLQTEKPDVRAIMKLSSNLSKLDPKFQRFHIDAKTIIHLGRDSIKDHTTALMELVKNSYDADASSVEVEIISATGNKHIRIADNGFGMTRQELINNWLRIGFSGKRESKVSDLGRRKTGEKGIGRISTDRLGAIITLKSKSADDTAVGLKLNWDDFDVEGKDVFDVDVELFVPDDLRIPQTSITPSTTGTEIVINELRQNWTSDNIEALYNELSALTPPFKKVTDFKVDLVNDVAPEFSHTVDSNYYETAEIDVSAVFDGTDEVYYSIKDRHSDTEIVDTINLNQFYTRAKFKDGTESLQCGPLEVRLMFFLRESASVVGTKFTLGDLREFLDNNAGVKIYRDNIAVKPYGFPKSQMGYDWLDLGTTRARNPAGVGRGDDYSVSPNQLVGAVFISRDNNQLLTDSAAREGLVESEGFMDMKQFVHAVKRLLETHYANIYPSIEKSNRKKKQVPAQQDAQNIQQKLDSVKSDLEGIKKDIETGDDGRSPSVFLPPINRSIEKVDSVSKEVEVTIEELLTWQRTLNGLATIGISSAVFGHETEGSLTQFKGSALTARKLLMVDPPEITEAMQEIEKSVRYSKKVAAWGAYALTRVQREKRSVRNTKVLNTIKTVVRELKPAFEASAITLSVKGIDFYSKTYPMDIETVLVNLLTNAYTACLQKGGERRVVVLTGLEDSLDGVRGFYFSVSDTGPGIAKEFKNRIFDPLFSTKMAGTNQSKSIGTGLGLTIVKSIVEELEGTISFDRDPDLKGAIFKVWLPKN